MSELSPTSYHFESNEPSHTAKYLWPEVLEAMTIGVLSPPPRVLDLTEEGFEGAAKDAHQRLGLANKTSVIDFIHEFGF